MITKKRTEITIETDRVFVLSRRNVSVVSWCLECRQRIRMIPAEEAAIFAGVSPRMLYRWIEAHEIHFLERADGLLLICPNSLPTASSNAALEIHNEGEKP